MDSLSVKIVADGAQPPTNQAEFSALATGSLLVFASGPYQGAWAVTKINSASVKRHFEYMSSCEDFGERR